MHIVVYGGCVPRKSLGAGAVGGRARVVARERRVILLLFVASVAFGRCERCDDVTCLLVVTRTKFVIVTFFYTLSERASRWAETWGICRATCMSGDVHVGHRQSPAVVASSCSRRQRDCADPPVTAWRPVSAAIRLP